MSWGIQALQRFYEMGESEGELEIAYSKLFTTATDWLSPLADWAIRDAREVGGLPRIYLSSQPVRPANESCRCCLQSCGDIQSSAVDRLQESAFVPEPPPERSRGRSTSEKSEPKAREVWTQTGFGTPMPRPIVRYGAPKVKAVAGESYFLSSSKKLTSRTLSVLAI